MGTFKITNQQSFRAGNVSTQSAVTAAVNSSAADKTPANTMISTPVVSSDGKTLVTKASSLADVVSNINKGTASVIPFASKTALNVPGASNKDLNQKQVASSKNVGAVNAGGVAKAATSGVAKAAASVINDIGDHIDVSNQNFTPAEMITGLSHERPEVIQMLNYLPLFDKTVGASGYNTSNQFNNSKFGFESTADFGFTAAGQFFDTTYKTRLMKIDNLQKTHKFIHKTDQDDNGTFASSIESVENMLRVMFTLTQSGNALKTVLGIREILCNIQTTVQLTIAGELRATGGQAESDLTRFDSVLTPKSLSPIIANGTFTVPMTLNALGFNIDVLKSVFSSTKLWMQLLYELRLILKNSSDYLVNVAPQPQQADVDPLVINKHTPNARRMGGRPIVVAPYGSRTVLPSYNDVILMTSIKDDTSLSSYVEMLVDAYSSVYSNVSFDGNESKISALTNFLSQEYRYSYALKQPEFKRILQNDYGYSTVVSKDDGTNNVDFLDAVLGKIPNRVTDIVVGNSPRSLVSVSQQVYANGTAVLPMESRYVDIESSTLTPGGTYYVDEALTTKDGQTFNTDSLESYFSVVADVLQHFIPVTLACNMYMFDSSTTDTNATDDVGWPKGPDQVFSDPRHLFVEIMNMLSHDNTTENNYGVGVNTSFDGFGKSGWHDDGTWSLFSYATQNPRVLALLFTLVSVRMGTTMSWVNASLPTATDKRIIVDKLIEQIESDLVVVSAMPASQVYNQNADKKTKQAKMQQPVGVPGETAQISYMSEDLLRAQLLRDGGVIDFVAGVMATMAYKLGDLLDTNPRSQYSGIPNALLNMLVFELMCLLIDSYGNVHLDHVANSIGYGVSQRTFYYKVKSAHADASITNVYSRLETERGRAQGLLLVTMSVLTEIAFGTKMYATILMPNADRYLSRNVSNSYVTQGVETLREITTLIQDPTYVNLLLSEQQLMTALNGVYDIETQLDKTTDAETAYAIIDDAADDPNHTTLLDTLYSVFSDQAFQSVSGYNKRIITVGLPTGFTHKFKQRRSDGSKNANDNNSKEYTRKVNDVVRIAIRKVDVRYNEIIFKPVTFLFDLSRYPARTSKLIKNDKNVTLANLASVVGTRDYGSIETLTTQPIVVNYYVPGAYTMSDYPVNTTETYPFLTTAQRAELHKNHVLSYLLEVYTRIMTGLNVSENAFTFKTNLASIQTPAKATAALQKITSAIIANAGKNGSQNTSIFSNAKKSSANNSTTYGASNNSDSTASMMTAAMRAGLNSSVILESCKQVSSYVNAFSTASNNIYAMQRMLQPKQFDRVFNVVIDPDDFEIDVVETKKVALGAQALDSLVQQGELIAIDSSTPEKQGFETTAMKYSSRQKTANDVTFEKYIVSVESFDDDGV